MCLAIYKPATTTPDWDGLQTAMLANADGAGFAIAKDGQLIIEKGFFRYEDFRAAFEPFAACPAVIHFRIATHGTTNQANCHPFALADFGGDGTPVAVIHNGIFSSASADKKQWSDTWHVCRDTLHPLWLAGDWLFANPGVRKLGDLFVGYGNKLVFLNAKGEFTIWGESNGHWAKDGHWYSNHSYQQYGAYCADPRNRSYGGWSSACSSYDDDHLSKPSYRWLHPGELLVKGDEKLTTAGQWIKWITGPGVCVRPDELHRFRRDRHTDRVATSVTVTGRRLTGSELMKADDYYMGTDGIEYTIPVADIGKRAPSGFLYYRRVTVQRPAAAGIGYRLVEEGDVLHEGDEYFSSGLWYVSLSVPGTAVSGTGCYRRPDTPPYRELLVGEVVAAGDQLRFNGTGSWSNVLRSIGHVVKEGDTDVYRRATIPDPNAPSAPWGKPPVSDTSDDADAPPVDEDDDCYGDEEVADTLLESMFGDDIRLHVLYDLLCDAGMTASSVYAMWDDNRSTEFNRAKMEVALGEAFGCDYDTLRGWVDKEVGKVEDREEARRFSL